MSCPQEPCSLLHELLRHEGSGPVETDPTGRYIRYPQVLGKGACKRVYKAFDQVDGIEVAWNQVELLGTDNLQEMKDRLAAEIRVLQQVKHRNIITFHDWWFDPRSQCVNFITEYFTSGTLRQFRKRARHITDQALKRWAWQIVEGLVYLHGHQPPVIHRDLKCDNIFVNGTSGQIKIGDLGLATCQTRGMSVVGTPEFMAPEIFDEQDYGELVDIYSFGMCLLELATLEYPYSECHGVAQIFKRVTMGVPPAAVGKVSSPSLQELIRQCIAFNPRDRPTARQLLKHPFFDSIRGDSSMGLSNSFLHLSAMESTCRMEPRHTVCVAAVARRNPPISNPIHSPQHSTDDYYADSDEEVLVPLEAIHAELTASRAPSAMHSRVPSSLPSRVPSALPSRAASALPSRVPSALPSPSARGYAGGLVSPDHPLHSLHLHRQLVLQEQQQAQQAQGTYISPRGMPSPRQQPPQQGPDSAAAHSVLQITTAKLQDGGGSSGSDASGYGSSGSSPSGREFQAQESTCNKHTLGRHRRLTSEVHAVLTAGMELFDPIKEEIDESLMPESPLQASSPQAKGRLSTQNSGSVRQYCSAIGPVVSPPEGSPKAGHRLRALIVRRKVAESMVPNTRCRGVTL